MTSGYLNIDLSKKMTEVLLKLLIESNGMLFPHLSSPLSFLFWCDHFDPPPTRAKVAETATGARVNKKKTTTTLIAPWGATFC